jgi:uncharacterized protein YjbJ (UPF0337 family)
MHPSLLIFGPAHKYRTIRERSLRDARARRVLERLENIMDKDRIEGAAKQVKGTIKEATGKVTGDTKTDAEGKAEKAAGKVQSAVGGAKDAVRDALKK